MEKHLPGESDFLAQQGQQCLGTSKCSRLCTESRATAGMSGIASPPALLPEAQAPKCLRLCSLLSLVLDETKQWRPWAVTRLEWGEPADLLHNAAQCIFRKFWVPGMTSLSDLL